jgi:hypothetical protein
MIIKSLDELTWKQFSELEEYKDKPLNEVKLAYNNYLVNLQSYRNLYLNFQNKGRALNNIKLPCSKGIDVAVVLDITTNAPSMVSRIEDMKTDLTAFVSIVDSRSGGNYRMGLVLFDEINSSATANYATVGTYTSLPASQREINTNTENKVSQLYTSLVPFSSNNGSTFITQFNKLNTLDFPLGSGEDINEPGDIAVKKVVEEDFVGAFRDGVVKYIILITNTKPSGDDDDGPVPNAEDVDILATSNTAAAKDIQISLISTTVAASNPAYGQFPSVTNGLYFTDPSQNSFFSLDQTIEDLCTTQNP